MDWNAESLVYRVQGLDTRIIGDGPGVDNLGMGREESSGE